MMPKAASPVAAPRPDRKPAIWPENTVRRMHSTPTGPTGMAMTMPTTSPFSRKPTSIRNRPPRKSPRASLGEAHRRRNPKSTACTGGQNPLLWRANQKRDAEETHDGGERSRQRAQIRVRFAGRRPPAAAVGVARPAGAGGQYGLVLRLYSAIP